MNEEKGLPLGICKQAVMKLESAMNDFNEIAEDEGVNDEQRLMFETLAEMAGQMMASIINIISSEIGEEEFLNEVVDMDAIDGYPEMEEETNILDEEI